MAVFSINANGNFPDDDGFVLDHPKTVMIQNPVGATVKLQYNPGTAASPDSDDWRDITDGSFTAAAEKNIAFNTAVKVRINVASYASAFTVEF